jgi:predicted RNA-binding protein YlxR (DUF448 family)
MEHATFGRSSAQPIRTCCGCGQRDGQGALLRMTVVDGALTVDVERRRGGRGAYLHPDRSCWQAFARGKEYVRSLRRRVSRAERTLLTAALGGGIDQGTGERSTLG